MYDMNIIDRGIEVIYKRPASGGVSCTAAECNDDRGSILHGPLCSRIVEMIE